MTAAKPWPAETTELLDIETLVPRARNARTHSQKQIEQIAALMLEFGWTTAVLIDEAGVIIAGHGRILAAAWILKTRKIERFRRAPVMTAHGWTEDEKRAYVIADNQVALNAGWDPALLEAELQHLSGAGIDMGLLAFTPAELRRLMRNGGGLTDPDAVPPVEPDEVSVPGDVWILGGHRLMCGSSTDADSVSRLLSGHVPALMVTDPPYGVSYDPTWREKATGQKVRARGKVLNDDRADWREAWALFPGDVAYVWHGALHAGTVQASLEAVGLEIRSQIIWAKDRFALSRGHYHWRHEPAWYAVRKGGSASWSGGRKRDTLYRIPSLPEGLPVDVEAVIEADGLEPTVWEIPVTVDDGATGHGTQKPVECMRRPIENHGAEGDFVYEPFSGSGSTIIACEQSGRRALAMELSPAYVDVAVRRWQAFTGQAAVLEGQNIPFASVALATGRSQEGGEDA